MFQGARGEGIQSHLNELQRWAQAMAISGDTRDGHETLRLLLQPPRSLCTSTGHYPYLPSREPVQPATTRVPDPRTTFPGEHMACLRVLQRHTGLCCCRLALRSVPLPPPGLSESEPLISYYFNPILSE